jgi:hypothetical protein
VDSRRCTPRYASITNMVIACAYPFLPTVSAELVTPTIFQLLNLQKQKVLCGGVVHIARAEPHLVELRRKHIHSASDNTVLYIDHPVVLSVTYPRLLSTAKRD